nr:hypothetical protein [Spirosoma endophyticum]
MNFKRWAKYNIDFTSAFDPFDMNRNRAKSLSLLRSNPSAMLLETDTEALKIWSLNYTLGIDEISQTSIR